jgi:hypothetical protein
LFKRAALKSSLCSDLDVELLGDPLRSLDERFVETVLVRLEPVDDDAEECAFH